MEKGRDVSFTIALFVSLVGGILFNVAVISNSSASVPEVKVEEKEPKKEQYVVGTGEGKEAVRAGLKDPDSAKFQNFFTSKYEYNGSRLTTCGEVNAKNSLGGYTGFKRYITFGNHVLMVENKENTDVFQTSWTLMCVE